MYIINDIELLQRLGKHRILEYMLEHCALAVSAIRLSDYSYATKQVVETTPHIKVLQVDNNFEDWYSGKRQYLSISDLSSLYVTFINKGSTLVVSTEDVFLMNEAKTNHIMFSPFDDFIISTINDEKIIRLYNLIKVA